MVTGRSFSSGHPPWRPLLCNDDGERGEGVEFSRRNREGEKVATKCSLQVAVEVQDAVWLLQRIRGRCLFYLNRTCASTNYRSVVPCLRVGVLGRGPAGERFNAIATDEHHVGGKL